MYINKISHYIPKTRVPNLYFSQLSGQDEDWIFQRTGIKTRSKAAKDENTNTMAIQASKQLSNIVNFPISEVDLIVGATYSPYDTVGTLAHAVQRSLNITNAKVVSISSACSSFINALEIVEGYFAMNKAKKAIIVASEHNSIYSNPENPKDGHLWGDGAVAVLVTKEKISEKDIHIKDILTFGLAHEGEGNLGVMLHPKFEGINMPHGNDVYLHAIKYMTELPKQLLKKNNMSVEDVDYLVPHQANIRIINKVAKKLKISKDKIFVNIEELGNTGCASSPIALSQNINILKKGDIIMMSVFGGGYSGGAVILEA
ncbi:MAG: ketoacyl-ACP synthase III [Chlorobi bacterium]|nr:ketoacyl-ACP synthase III [Chlorobiota bacterium]